MRCDDISVCELVRHHISCGAVFDPITGQEYKVNGVSYLISTNTHKAPLPPALAGVCALINWDQPRY